MLSQPNRLLTTYAQFWPFYLQEHALAATRHIHFVGTAAALVLLGAGVAGGRAAFFLLALVAGYAPAWFAHFFVEKNRPATFTHPLWSLISDFRMAWLWITARLQRELAKAGVRPR